LPVRTCLCAVDVTLRDELPAARVPEAVVAAVPAVDRGGAAAVAPAATGDCFPLLLPLTRGGSAVEANVSHGEVHAAVLCAPRARRCSAMARNTRRAVNMVWRMQSTGKRATAVSDGLRFRGENTVVASRRRRRSFGLCMTNRSFTHLSKVFAAGGS
jgi:hypothetical protein